VDLKTHEWYPNNEKQMVLVPIYCGSFRRGQLPYKKLVRVLGVLANYSTVPVECRSYKVQAAVSKNITGVLHDFMCKLLGPSYM
jgi:hypothetical protein